MTAKEIVSLYKQVGLMGLVASITPEQVYESMSNELDERIKNHLYRFATSLHELKQTEVLLKTISHWVDVPEDDLDAGFGVDTSMED